MKVYYATDLDYAKNVFSEYNSKKINETTNANIMLCPAVRNSLKNIWSFGKNETFGFDYDLNYVTGRNVQDPVFRRQPMFENTNIINTGMSSLLFSESPLIAKVSAPYFHQAEYQKNGTFVGGKYDIGRWLRPIDAEIITWNEKGSIDFIGGQPMYYVEFLTDEKIEMVKYSATEDIHAFVTGLVSSPFQNKKNLQGSLDSRYEGFDRSDYRAAILEEIQANLLPAEG